MLILSAWANEGPNLIKAAGYVPPEILHDIPLLGLSLILKLCSFLRASSFLDAAASLGLSVSLRQSVHLSVFSKTSVGGSRNCPVQSCIVYIPLNTSIVKRIPV